MKKFLEIVYQDEELADEVYIHGFGFVSTKTKTKEMTKLQISRATNIFSLLIIVYFVLNGLLFRPFTLFCNTLALQSTIIFTNTEFINIVLSSMIDLTSFSLIIIIGYLLNKDFYKKDMFFKKVKVQSLLTSIVVTTSFWIVANFIAIILEELFKIVGVINAPAFKSISLIDSIVQDNIFLLILISVLQEVFFRGLVLFKMREFGDTFAIITTSLLFCSISTEFLVGVKWFILSLALCYFTLKYCNIMVAITTRLFCSVAFQIVRILFYSVNIDIGSNLITVISIVMLVLGLYLFFKLDFKIDDNDEQMDNNEKIFMFVSSFSFIALAIVSIFKAQEVLQFIG